MEPEGCSDKNHRPAQDSCPARGTVKKRTSRAGNPRGGRLRRDAMAQSPAMNSPKRLTGGLVALVVGPGRCRLRLLHPHDRPRDHGPHADGDRGPHRSPRDRRLPRRGSFVLAHRLRVRRVRHRRAGRHGGRQRPQRRRLRGDRGPGPGAARHHRHDAGRARRVRHAQPVRLPARGLPQGQPRGARQGHRDPVQGARADAPGRLARAALPGAADEPGRGPVRRRDQADVRGLQGRRHRPRRGDHLRPRVHPRAAGPAVQPAQGGGRGHRPERSHDGPRGGRRG